MKIRIKKLTDTARLPAYGSASAAGADLYSDEGAVTVAPGETHLFHTGLSMEIPEGYGGFVHARSGLATKRGLAPANKVGVIDADYRGEWFIPLHNHGERPQTVQPGERIAQLVLVPCMTASFFEADSLDETARGAGGFGSTGRN